MSLLFYNQNKYKNNRQKGESLMIYPSDYVCIDIETTGLDPTQDKIIEIAAIKVVDNQVVDSYSSLINPNIIVNDFIVELTGITNQELANAPTIEQILPEFINFVGDNIVVGHNVHFDINFIYDNSMKFLGKPFSNDFIDTLRLSRKLLPSIKSHRLHLLTEYFNINVNEFHRALSDVYTTVKIFNELEKQEQISVEVYQNRLDDFSPNENNPYYGKKISFRGTPVIYPYSFLQKVAKKCNISKFYDFCYPKYTEVLILGMHTYKNYLKAKENEEYYSKYLGKVENTISEKEFYESLNFPFDYIENSKKNSSTKASDLFTIKTDFDENHPLHNKQCVFTGTLEKMVRKDAMQFVLDCGGFVGDSVTKKTNFLILGNTDYSVAIKDGKSSKHKKAEKLKLEGQEIEIISENTFYDILDA